MSDIALLWPWVETLAVAYAIPPDTLFAIHLCIEESVSNIIRHGYQGQPGHRVTVDFSPGPANGPANRLVFSIEDQAPPFNPLEDLAVPAMAAAGSIDRLNPGGHGIRLLRKFAAALDYERLANGNRLTIRFTVPA
jgi:anti-sigma regulatory factor (Ser/Thr protein kinase)